MSRGFGSTLGAGTSDLVKTGLTTNNAQRSFFIAANRNGNGGGSLGRMVDKFVGSVVDIIYTDTTNYLYQHGFSTTNGVWSWTRPSAGTWANIAIAYDASSTANNPVVYQDGSLQTLTKSSSPAGTTNTNVDAYTIGNRESDGARNWDGSLANFAVWDAVLTAEEMIALGKGASPQLIRPQSLVCFIPMIRDNVDLVRGGAPTITGTAVQPHPRMWLPETVLYAKPSAAAAGSGALSAVGTGVASWTGEALNSQPWSSAGVGAASWTGAQLNSQPWSAAGTGAASWVGSSTSAGSADWSAAGTGAASWAGAATADSVWGAAGVGAASWAGAGGAVTTTTPEAGGGKPRRKRHYVEIEGQYFEVRDHEHAVKILTKLNEAAKEAAPVAVKKAVAEKKQPAPPVMRVVKPDYKQEFVQQLQAQVDAANARMAQVWQEAAQAEMVAARFAAELAQEEDDIETLIALGIL